MLSELKRRLLPINGERSSNQIDGLTSPFYRARGSLSVKRKSFAVKKRRGVLAIEGTPERIGGPHSARHNDSQESQLNA
jgi:hypothetical protein